MVQGRCAQGLLEQGEKAPNLGQKHQKFLNSQGTGLSHEGNMTFFEISKCREDGNSGCKRQQRSFIIEMQVIE